MPCNHFESKSLKPSCSKTANKKKLLKLLLSDSEDSESEKEQDDEDRSIDEISGKEKKRAFGFSAATNG